MFRKADQNFFLLASAGQPSATCYDQSVATNQIQAIVTADSAGGVCSSSCSGFSTTVAACVNSQTTNIGLEQCLCQSGNLSLMFNCSGCEDSMDTDGSKGYFTNRASSFCNQCISDGFQASGACGVPIPQGNPSLPACPTPSASASASISASATISHSQSASATAS